MKTPPELGDLVEVHRPMRGYTGWIPVLVMPLGFGLFAFFGQPGPLVGVLIFLGFLLPIMYGTAEWFLLEHRIHRHGIVFRSLVPGLKTYVVPYSTCDPGSLSTIGRSVQEHTGQSLTVSRRFRTTGMTRTNILMDGLEPDVAMAIGAGKEPWATSSSFRSNALTLSMPRGTETWVFSSRAPEHHVALLRDLITADRTRRSGTTA